MHLWTSADPNKRAHLAGLTVRGVWEGRGSFHRVARKLLADAAAAGTLCGPIREQVEAEIARAGGVQPVFPSWPPEEKKKD